MGKNDHEEKYIHIEREIVEEIVDAIKGIGIFLWAAVSAIFTFYMLIKSCGPDGNTPIVPFFIVTAILLVNSILAIVNTVRVME